MRVLTRADLDGLVCAVLIKKTENVQEVRFSEPKFVQDGEVEIGPDDILANLPYDSRCGMWFDHHLANTKPKEFKGGFKTAPSAARVVYDYYLPNFPELSKYEELINETDKIDAAELTYAEVMDPEKYLLLSMTIDGKYYDDKPYWLHLIDLLSEKDIDTIMQDAQVKQKCDSFLQDNEKYKQLVHDNSRVEKNVLITDLRKYDELPRGNRYFVYAFQSATNISVKIANDIERPENVTIGVGYNIFNKTANINIGQLLKKYGGGGHKAVGSTRVPKEKADEVVEQLLKYLIER